MKICHRVITSVLLTLLLQINSNAQNNLSDKINNLFADSLFETSSAAVNIYDLTTRKTLYEKNTKLLFRPASNLKILTSAAALYFLGPNYQFQTSVYHSGKITDSVCYGDLYVVGGCDPNFSIEDLDTMIIKIREYGIKEIKGNMYGDVTMMDSLFWGNGWMWDDDPSSDAPYLSALNINSNCVNLMIEPGNLNSPAKITMYPESRYYNVINNSLTFESDTSWIEVTRDWVNRTNNFIVSGGISSKEIALYDNLNVFNPGMFFLTLFKEGLNKHSISFNGNISFAPYDTNSNLVYSKNRSYKKVNEKLNKESDNLCAEMTLRALAQFYFYKPATAAKGILLIDSLIKLTGLNPDKYRIVDGSGVSHYNLVSSELILEVLKFIYNARPELYDILYNSFPVAGVDGTLKRRMKDNPVYGNVHAKTGTLSGVSCLSGYVTSANGHIVAFSIFVQNYVGSSRNAVKFQDSICRIIAEYK